MAYNAILDNYSALSKVKQRLGLHQVEFHKPSDYIAHHQINKGITKAFNECKAELLAEFRFKKRKIDGYLITQEGELEVLLAETIRYIDKMHLQELELLSEEISKTDYLCVLCRLFQRRIK